MLGSHFPQLQPFDNAAAAKCEVGLRTESGVASSQTIGSAFRGPPQKREADSLCPFRRHSIRRLEQEACIRPAEPDHLIEARPGKPVRAWLRIIVDDFDHDVHEVLATVRQHYLRSFAVTNRGRFDQGRTHRSQTAVRSVHRALP